MDTTIRNLKRESGIQDDGASALSLMAEARELRARTLETLFRRLVAAVRSRMRRAGHTAPMHPAG